MTSCFHTSSAQFDSHDSMFSFPHSMQTDVTRCIRRKISLHSHHMWVPHRKNLTATNIFAKHHTVFNRFTKKLWLKKIRDCKKFIWLSSSPPVPSAAEVTRFFSRPDLSSFLENLSEIDRDVATQIRSSNQIAARMIWDGSWGSLIRSGQPIYNHWYWETLI